MSNQQQKDLNIKSVIRTKSHIKAWYLTHIRGLKLWSVQATPELTLIGTMYYTKTWTIVSY